MSMISTERFTPITVAEFVERLTEGKHVWPGGYALYLVMADGEALSFEAAIENAVEIKQAIEDDDKTGGWLPIGFDVNWEDNELFCAHSGVKIEPEYIDD